MRLADQNIEYTFETVPGLGRYIPSAPGTTPHTINDLGQIAASTGGRGLFHGTVFGAETPVFPGYNFSALSGINNLGQLVGAVWEPGPQQGVLATGGHLEVFSYPDSFATYAHDINDSGLIVGHYSDDQQVIHGFVGTPDHLCSVNVPGASSTRAEAINNWGHIAGWYSDTSGQQHGFLSVRGHYVTVDVPEMRETAVTGINDWGQLVGSYLDNENHRHGFVLTGKHFQTIDLPDAISTSVSDVNNLGQIVGISSYRADVPFVGNVQQERGWIGSPEFIHDEECGDTAFLRHGLNLTRSPEEEDALSFFRSMADADWNLDLPEDLCNWAEAKCGRSPALTHHHDNHDAGAFWHRDWAHPSEQGHADWKYADL